MRNLLIGFILGWLLNTYCESKGKYEACRQGHLFQCLGLLSTDAKSGIDSIKKQ